MLCRRRDLSMVALALAACGAEPAAPPPSLRVLHTFAPAETEALNELLAGRHVEASIVPFARGQSVIGELLRRGVDCPDLIRIDATWLPALARADLLTAPPADLAGRDWLAEAAELGRDGDRLWAVPQTVDGLAVLARAPAVAGPIDSVDALVARAAEAQRAGARHGLGLRVDGYWLIPFLRAAGSDVAAGADIDGPGARAAVDRFAGLFGTVAAPPPPPGAEAREEARRFRAGEIALLVTGPWALADVADGDLDAIAVHALPGAPRGGQLLVVPRCASHVDAGWTLAGELTSAPVQAAWSRRFGTVPTTIRGLADGAAVSRAMRDALQAARPLPHEPASALLFDDLNPALAAVVAGDATAAEALPGVARAWRRLAPRPDPSAPPAPLQTPRPHPSLPPPPSPSPPRSRRPATPTARGLP